MKRILVTSPTLTGGSWILVEELLKPLMAKAPDIEVNVIGLGIGRDLPGAKVLKIPYYSYEKLRPSFGGNLFFNILYQLPLQLAALYKLFVLRPNAIVSNGYTAPLLILPFAKLMGIPTFIYYGTALGTWLDSKPIYLGVKFLGFLTTTIFVNSIDSKIEVLRFADEKKIHLINMWTPFKAVSKEDRKRIRKEYGVSEDKFIFLFTNRMIPEKGFRTLLDVMKLSKDVKNLEFWIGGDGMLKDELLELEKNQKNVKYLGFIVDRIKMKELLTVADLVWSSADETYYVMPAVEALANGTPIMIPNVAGTTPKYKAKVRIKKDLVPEKIGWVIENDDPVFIKNTIANLVETKGTDKMRKDCEEFALENHSEKNIDNAVDKIIFAAKSLYHGHN